jgi:hypothetical protein
VSVGAMESLTGVVECGCIRLVADRPLLHRLDARMLCPECLRLDDHRIELADDHVPLPDVEQRPSAPGERGPIPRTAAEQTMAGDEPEIGLARPCREHPLLDGGVSMAAVHGRQATAATSMRSGKLDGMVRYLSLDWIDQLRRAVHGNEHLAELAKSHEIGLTQLVTDGPEGTVTYHLQVANGTAQFGPGEADPEHVRMEQSWDTAVAVATGEMNAQEAFINGNIRLYGDQQRLLDSQPVFGALDAIFAGVREQTDYT